MRPLSLLFLAPLFAFAACSGNSAAGKVPNTVIDANGGTLEVTEGPLAGTKIEIKPGTVAGSLSISIVSSQVQAVPGAVALGPAAALQPTNTTFEPGATATFVFDESLLIQNDFLSRNTTADDIVLKRRNSQGRIVNVKPDSVDLVRGTVTATLTDFASFWVAADVQPDFDLTEYFPLNNGDIRGFDNGVTMTVRFSNSEPNLGGIPIVRLILERPAQGGGVDDLGFYLQRSLIDGETFFAGQFSLTQSFQEISDFLLPWLPPIGRLGDSLDDFSEFVRFEPFGSDLPVRTGIVETRTRILTQGSIATPLGTFEDSLEVEITTFRRFGNSNLPTERVDKLWLVRGVGPVQIQFSPFGTGKLTSAVVDGVTIE